MSKHKSYNRSIKSGDASRSVLKRGERVKLLMQKGMWNDSMSVTGMHKTKTT